MHNHRTSCCIVLHKFTAILVRKIKTILSTTASSGDNRFFSFSLVVEESCCVWYRGHAYGVDGSAKKHSNDV